MQLFFDTLTDLSGNALLGATVQVLNWPSLTNANIYSTNGTTSPIANSTVAADLTGQISFYAPDGDYQLNYSYKGTQYKVRSPVNIYDGGCLITLADTGAVNAYATSSSNQESTLRTGLRVNIQIANANTISTPTYSYNGLTPKTIVNTDGTALTVGVLAVGGIYLLEYTGTVWQLRQTSPIPYFAVIAAETAASVVPTNFNYPPFDIRRYGGDPTGVATSDTALANAIAVAGAAGMTIRFPGIGGANGSNYTFANQLSVSQKSAIIFEGDGGPSSAFSTPTKLTYTGTASPWISAPNATGFLIRRMSLTASNVGFAGGVLIAYGQVAGNPAAFVGLDDVAMGSSAVAVTHLNLDATINVLCRRVLFLNGHANGSIVGQSSAGGSFSNVVKFDTCEWTGGNGAYIQYGGDDWTFDECTFEKLANGTLGVFNSTASTPNKALQFRNCWQGDSTVGGTTCIVFYGQGLTIDGGHWSGTATSTFLSLNAASGVKVHALLESWQVVIDFTTATIAAVELRGRLTGITNVFGTVANAPLNLVYNPVSVSNIASPIAPPSTCGVNGTNGWKVDPDGRIEQWGNNAVTAGTPNAISFTKQFPNALWNVQLTLVTIGTGATTAYATSLSTSGMTLNIAGGSAASTVHWRVIGN